VADGSADLPVSGMTCNDADTPGLQVNHWSFEPTNWRLTWSGWEVSQGAYTIEFSHYAPVPPQTQQELASQFKLEKEED